MATSSDKTYIGLDVGERRIGVARVHEIAKIAEPLEHIETSNNNVVDSIKRVIHEFSAEGIVVGLPRGLDGQETAQTKYCREFAEKLNSEISTPVYLVDEAGTSKTADERLVNNSKISRDSMAAAVLLEDFIAFRNKEELRV